MKALSPKQTRYVAEWSKDFNMKRTASSLCRSVKTVDWALRESRRRLGLPSLHHLAAWTVRGLCVAITATALAQYPPMPPKPKSGPTTNSPSVTLVWDASPSANVAGYWIYVGPATRFYTNQIDARTNLTLTISNLVRGATYFFAATAYAINGLESDFSNEATLTFPLPPEAPTNFRITAQVGKTAAGPWQPLTNMPSVVVTNTGKDQFYRLDIQPEK